MIKIQDYLDRIDSNTYLQKKADKHWDILNPRNSKGYKNNSLIEKCKKFYKESSTEEYKKKYAYNDSNTAKRQKKFFLLLKKDKFKFFKRLLVSEPKDFLSLQLEIYNILNVKDLIKKKGEIVSQTAFGKLLTSEIFNYSSFRDSKYCKDLYTELGFENASCPYCNDQTVEIIKKENKNVAYFDLDHFYPKSVNPFFALSFYNLIPSCKFCNSIDKGSKNFRLKTHIHPYVCSFDDYYKFTISIKTLLGSPIEYVDFISKTSSTFLNIVDFNLVNRYDHRLESAQKMINFYQNNYKKLKTANEIKFFRDYFFDALNIPIEKKMILKISRSKLYRDLLIELDKGNLLGIIP